MTPKTVTFVFAALAGILSPSALADTIHVPGDAPTIQAGLDLASAGDTVVVADGVWTGAGNRDLLFPPFDMVLTSAGGAAACTIDSQGTATVPHRGLTLRGDRTRASVVRGFTFTGGTTEIGAVDDQYNAGGLLIHGGSPTIAECRFVDNICACWGGAICISFSDSPRITGCYFEGNQSGDEGGALFAWGNSQGGVELDNSVFIRNIAGNVGGAIASFQPIRLDHLTVVQNFASGQAGGLFINSSVMTNSIVFGNRAPFNAGMLTWSSTIDFSVTQASQAGTGNSTGDPLFRPDGWHLRRSVSPCIDAADPMDQPSRGAVDVDGQPRMSGLWTDIGADEARIVDRAPL